jgi:DNA-binding transcriptional LysR family regulator
VRRLAESTQRLVASPGLVEGCFSRPLVPADLTVMPSLSWGPSTGGHEWRLEGPQGATATVPHDPRLVTEDMVALRQAALSGIGVCQFPTMVVQEDLATGRLIDILPQWAPRSGIIHAAFPSRRGLLPSVRALMDYLAAEYALLSKAEQRAHTA